ncbi:diguanylate cyclase [Paucibacter sp. PLA-PC-4]|uniref:diguanylate cyclase n=1 Tax=Paucibacter sp. PLA-PC-4 TaxID=2993655 RepID=UPI002248B152|nr:diguanylate cyclase [Paucibacter sp. PLA-PC-4]MCX2861488.1 diguanylate cyclase [Paucibacter sp. PLA-PC-4]
MNGWRITESLPGSRRNGVLRAVDAQGQRAVLVYLRAAMPSAAELARFRYEFEIARRFDHPHILRPDALASHAGRPYMRLPDLGLQTLRQWLISSAAPLSQPDVLRLGLALVDALEVIHEQGVVHRDLHPGNVLLSQHDDPLARILLGDFGIAAEIAQERALLLRADALDGSLATLAPEQTGRMSRDVDYRADFYSLGATLYEALTGSPLFDCQDAAQAVHAHLAVPAPLATARRADASPALAALLERCLQKEPEARYQSHPALRQDLALCLAALTEGREPPHFMPGRGDRSDRFQLSGRLYGRESELRQLGAAFEAAAAGASQLVGIAGLSGIGKTALVNAAQRSLMAQRGSFVAAKFNQFGQHQPYGALLSLLAQRAGQILAQAPARQLFWRERLCQRLGSAAAVVAEAIAEFKPLLGEPAVPVALAPSEAESRFMRSLRLCLAALASEDEPQTLFLDDLQWADRSSRRLLREWAGDTELRHTLIVLAWRDNELPLEHPLSQDLVELRALGPRFLALSIAPLGAGEIGQLLADSLHRPAAEVAELATLCLAKTAGNPFFLRRFVEELVQRRLIHFDLAGQRWDWSAAQIAQAQLADNVVELMLAQLQPLPEACRRMLSVGAFLGGSFDLDTLATALDRPGTEVATGLLPALQAQLLVPGNKLYRYAAHLAPSEQAVRYAFAHDRVQEAAWRLVPEHSRARLHLQIGRLLRSRHQSPAALPFHVLNHLNAAETLISEPSERAALAVANEQASQQAMNAAAFDLAADFAEMALRLQDETAWAGRPEALLVVHLQAARMAYLSGRHDRMDELLAAALARLSEPAQRARLLEVRIEASYAQGQLSDTLDLGLQVLAMLGAELPQADSPAQVVALVASVRDELNALGLPALAALAPMSDARMLQLISISAKMTAAAYIARPALLPLLTVFQVRLMMTHGHVPGALSAYSVLGLMWAEFLGDYRQAYALGRLSMQLVREHGWLQVYAHAGFSFNAFLQHWIEPLSQGLPGLMETHRNGLEGGNLRHAGLGLYVHDCHAFLAGQPLPALAQSLSVHRDTLQRMRQPVAADYQDALLALVQELLLPTLPALALESGPCSGRALAAVYQQRKDQTGLMFLHAWRALLHFLAERPAEALLEARSASALFAAARGMHAVPLVVFIAALAGLRCAGAAREAALAEAELALHKLGRWNEAGPGTFSAKYHLLAAELAWARGEDALPAFDAAVASAEQPLTGTPLDAGLAHGARGRYLAATRPHEPAAAHAALAQARLNWLQWGAPGVAQRTLPTPTPEAPRRSDAVDVSSLMKAMQAINAEAELPRLLQRLLRVVGENAGAQRAAIVLASGHNRAGAGAEPRWTLRADVGLGDTEGQMTPLALEQAGGRLPLSLLRRVLAGGKTLLIDDARSALDAQREPYFAARQARSVLSTPLLKQGHTVGALYLENASAAGVFTTGRVEFLELLCANVVNAVDNARLVAELQDLTTGLEQRVEQRTQELRESEQRLRTILDNAPVPMTLTRRSDAVLIYANESAARLADRPLNDIVGRPAESFYRDPQERARLQAKFLREGRLVDEEVSLLGSGGSVLWVMVSMVPVSYNGELADLATIVDITERKQLELELQRLATTDALTGVANRRSFIEQAERELERARRHGLPLALVMMDIDHFKRINDSLGHAGGDAAIRQVVQACAQLVRRLDVIGRLGGEEFALLLPQTELAAAQPLVERLRGQIAALMPDHEGGALTASFGITALRAGDCQVDELLLRADEALYAAKNQGRNCVVSR